MRQKGTYGNVVLESRAAAGVFPRDDYGEDMRLSASGIFRGLMRGIAGD